MVSDCPLYALKARRRVVRNPEFVPDTRGQCPRSDLDLDGKAFLDIGFGQGLSLMIAHQEGAVVTGMDINPKCAQIVERNKKVLGINDEIETGYYVHKSSLDNLDYDEEMNIVASKAQFREAVMPHGVVRSTLQDTAALLGASGTYVLNKYGTTHIVKAKADEYQGDMELTLRLLP